MNLRTVVGIAVVAVVALGIILRFYTHSALWLDEALTVDRARLPALADRRVGQAGRGAAALLLPAALLDAAVRAVGRGHPLASGVIGVITLPVAWLAGNRFGGRVVAWTTLVLLASAPFAVYYSTEARMYGLVIFLTGCGFLALHRALEAPRPGNLIATAVVTAALLYTQYWSLYLVGVVGLWLLVDRRCGRGAAGAGRGAAAGSAR